jgi:diguanylate cyclase (GGDEF)-like protein
MKKISPLVQMTMALVALASMLVILASLFFDVVPDREGSTRASRQAVADALAVQMAERLMRDDAASVEKTLRHVIARTPDLRSVAVRREGGPAPGTLVIDSGHHAQHWRLGAQDVSRIDRITVPLRAQDGVWGRLELAYRQNDVHPVKAFLQEPLVQLLLFITVGGWLVFGLYMRRALQHLDPSTVVPARVQGAFDAMAEGVVVLDAKGRIMMCNHAFRALDVSFKTVPLGTRLGMLPFFAPAASGHDDHQPWSRAMSECKANAGTSVDVGEGAQARHFVINASPISDAGNAVRGCMVTIADMTTLQRTNEALQDAMAELKRSSLEIETKNAELERLATRDPLTGVLNRRAFEAAYNRVAEQARLKHEPVSCLMIDIDHFKAVNDTHGHSLGDRVIQEVARRLQDSLRGTDLVARWGGEEFCVVIAGVDRDGAADFGERLRLRIEREAGAAVREVAGLHVTCSVGVAHLHEGSQDGSQGGVHSDLPGDATLTALVDRADQALYTAKRSGRNRVAIWGDQPLDQRFPHEYLDGLVGCLNREGWASARKQLLADAKAQDRSVACWVAACGPVHDGKALARWFQLSMPRQAVMTCLPDDTVALMVMGQGMEEAKAQAEHWVQRWRAEARVTDAAMGSPAWLCIGVDALAARAPGAVTLPERAAQALTRLRHAGGQGVGLFATSLRVADVPTASKRGST